MHIRWLHIINFFNFGLVLSSGHNKDSSDDDSDDDGDDDDDKASEDKRDETESQMPQGQGLSSLVSSYNSDDSDDEVETEEKKEEGKAETGKVTMNVRVWGGVGEGGGQVARGWRGREGEGRNGGESVEGLSFNLEF